MAMPCCSNSMLESRNCESVCLVRTLAALKRQGWHAEVLLLLLLLQSVPRKTVGRNVDRHAYCCEGVQGQYGCSGTCPGQSRRAGVWVERCGWSTCAMFCFCMICNQTVHDYTIRPHARSIHGQQPVLSSLARGTDQPAGPLQEGI